METLHIVKEVKYLSKICLLSTLISELVPWKVDDLIFRANAAKRTRYINVKSKTTTKTKIRSKI